MSAARPARSPTVQVCTDLEAMSRAAAELFAGCVRRAGAEARSTSVALSGGSTPRRTYELLASPPYRDAVHWERVHVFWGDERCVASDDPRSNARMAREAMLDRVSIPPANLHPIPAALGPRRAAALYEETLRAFFAGGSPRFDLVLLGLGADGHTASLFPGSAALLESERWVAPVEERRDSVQRVTLTPRPLNSAALILFLVAGAAKASILREVLAAPDETGLPLPAQLIQPEAGRLLFLVDEAAAAHLPGVG